MSDLEIPGCFDGAPGLLKLGGIWFAEMGFGVALHMHDTELNVGVGKEALGMGSSPEKSSCTSSSRRRRPRSSKLRRTSFQSSRFSRPGRGQQVRTCFLPSRLRPTTT